MSKPCKGLTSMLQYLEMDLRLLNLKQTQSFGDQGTAPFVVVGTGSASIYSNSSKASQ